jgi:probable phosphoglycerate mutase
VYLGDWEGGVLRQKVADDDPIAVRMLAEQRWELIPGAERSSEFAERVRAGIDAIAAAHTGGRVVIVTHGGTIGEALRHVTNSRPFAFVGADNASISSIVVMPAGSVLRGFNDISHLDVTSSAMT